MRIIKDRIREPPSIIIRKGESLAEYCPESNSIRLGGDLRSFGLSSHFEEFVLHYLIHEIHHWLLCKLEDYETSEKYQTICQEVEGSFEMSTKISPNILRALAYLSDKQ